MTLKNEKRDEVLRRMLNTPPKPHEDMKVKPNETKARQKAKGPETRPAPKR